MEEAIKQGKGEIDELSVLPLWERARVQTDSGAIDTLGPKEIAKAFEGKETDKREQHQELWREKDRGLHR